MKEIEELQHSVINGVQSETRTPHDKKPTNMMTMEELSRALNGRIILEKDKNK